LEEVRVVWDFCDELWGVVDGVVCVNDLEVELFCYLWLCELFYSDDDLCIVVVSVCDFVYVYFCYEDLLIVFEVVDCLKVFLF